MRQYRALLRGQGTSIVGLYWVGCIIDMYGFDLRQAQPSSPRQNGFRLIGSIRRECLDHVIVLGEAHLRRILRTHRSLDMDAPVTRQIQRIGSIKSHAILGGLHHHYAPELKFSVHTTTSSLTISKPRSTPPSNYNHLRYHEHQQSDPG
jgi:hypothetical protein